MPTPAMAGSPRLVAAAGSQLTPHLVGGVAFGQRSPEAAVDAGDTDLTVTPANEVGVFLEQQSVDLPEGDYRQLFLVGLPGDLQSVLLSYDQRTFATHGRVRIFNGAARFQTLDAYLVDPSVDISLTAPTYSTLLFGTGSGWVSAEPGEYNLILTEEDTKHIISGPTPLLIEARDVLELVITDAADITQADVLVFETGAM